MEESMADNVYYNAIMALHGLEDFKDVIDQWQRLSDNVYKFHAKQGLVLPNMLWSSDNGIDNDNLLSLLTGFLVSAGNLLDFYGSVKCLEYYLSYVPKEKEAFEIEKIGEKIRDAAGFRSEYRGVLSIDVSEWMDHFHENHFINVLKYLASMDEDILYVFHIPNYNQKAVEQLMQMLVMFFRIQSIEMHLPDSEELGNYIKGEIAEYGLNLDAEAEAMVVSSVNRMREDKYFAGYTMLNRLASDIVYSVYTSSPPYDGIVTKAMINDFAPDGIYVSQLLWNNAKVFTEQYSNEVEGGSEGVGETGGVTISKHLGGSRNVIKI